MKLSRIYYARARRKALIGVTVLSLAVTGNIWSLALLTTLPVTGFCLMAVALMTFAVAIELLAGSFDLWRAGRIERIVENSNLPI